MLIPLRHAFDYAVFDMPCWFYADADAMLRYADFFAPCCRCLRHAATDAADIAAIDYRRHCH